MSVIVVPREGARGMTWKLQGRAGGRQFARTFPTEEEARHWLGVFDAMRDDAKALALLDASLAKPTEPEPQGPTVRTAVSAYLDTLSHITTGTAARYRRESERDIFKHMGSMPIADLDEDRIAQWVGELRLKGLSRKTIKNRIGILSPACKYAGRKGWMNGNPCEGVKLPTNIKRPMVCLEIDEIKQLLDALDSIDSRYRNFITVLVGTGMRWGEATALDVRDVIRNDGGLTIRITKAWKEIYTGKPLLGPPKTENGTRDIYVPAGSSVAVALEKELQLRTSPYELLFQSPQGHLLRNSEFHNRVWQPLLRELKARKFPKQPRIHDLRHTAASIMLNSNMPLMAVSKVLGHDKPSTTTDIYGHVMSGAKDAASAALANLIP